MEDDKKSSISLWVGVTGIILSMISAFAAATEPSAEHNLKQTMQQLMGTGHLGGGAGKEERCRDAASSQSKLDESRRPLEELISVCLALPSDHDTNCGFPASSDEYFVVEDQQCVTKIAGKSQEHSHARKVEARARPASFFNDPDTAGSADSSDEHDGATGAQ